MIFIVKRNYSTCLLYFFKIFGQCARQLVVVMNRGSFAGL